ncbi:MAG: hypothetical protein QMC95_01690 [Desulfitobacteriaceae bacterium]|nr:hypothetical protein [Desulfitobacteriaceae bacterium]MDI6877745.1 hypothetical protein [Desulfitobacteriaceae bacterium]MDI6912915.1 hypothetical protein [Desulfitobacteriaceae bacterium]
MNTYRPTQPSRHWVTLLKVLVLLFVLYFAVAVLGKVFSWVLAIVFVVVRGAVFVALIFFVTHFLLKLLFGFDLYRWVVNGRFRR